MDLSFGYRDSSAIYAALSQANVLCHMYAPGELLHHVQTQQKIIEFRTNVFLKINFSPKKKKERNQLLENKVMKPNSFR